MRAQEVIRAKRDGAALDGAQIDAFVQGLVSRSWSEGQAAALAMAICLRGMTRAETTLLTRAMAASGQRLDWSREHWPGPLLDKLNQLTRADVTTRNADRAGAFARLQDDLEERIARLAEQENLDAMRPPLDGRQVMEHLSLPPGPQVGEALAFLMEHRMERGPIEEAEAFELLDAWAKDRGLS